jgi:hypothetical protein
MLARARWLHGPVADLSLAFCWIPAAVAAHLLTPNPAALRQLVGVVFLVSFFHQPLTLALVYADGAQYEARKRLYQFAPVVAVAAIAIGLNVSLTAIALVAGLWNIEHTLMQRYGLTRMYGRKAGDDNGKLEKAMIISWLGLAMAWAAAFIDLPKLVNRIGMGSTNARGVAMLHRTQPVARYVVGPAVIVSVLIMWKWFLAERALGDRANPAKHLYLLATAAMVLLVVVDPISGFAGYVAGHSIEYLVIVQRSLRSRAATGDTSLVARLSASRWRRVVLYGAYTAVIVGFIYVAPSLPGGHWYGYSILFFGALHILYDGFVWKLRRPQLAASLGLHSPPVLTSTVPTRTVPTITVPTNTLPTHTLPTHTVPTHTAAPVSVSVGQ